MVSGANEKRERSRLSHVLCIIIFTCIVWFCAVLQCSSFELFGITPDITFALVCAVGFVAGERYGGIFGLLGGVIIMALGASGISLAPVMLTLCGYLCGILPEVMLRRNFLSYLVYTAMMGGVHIIFTVIYFIMLSGSFEFWNALGRLIIPEFFALVIFMIPSYGIIFGIYKLFKGKKKEQRA